MRKVEIPVRPCQPFPVRAVRRATNPIPRVVNAKSRLRSKLLFFFIAVVAQPRPRIYDILSAPPLPRYAFRFVQRRRRACLVYAVAYVNHEVFH